MPAHAKARHVSLGARVQPPADLPDAERAVFVMITESVDPAHFHVTDMPLLTQYASAAVLARTAADKITAEGAVLPDGKVSGWVGVFEKSSRACVALAARLRLAPQSRYDRLVAGSNTRPQPGTRKPWETDPPEEHSLLA